MTTTVKNNPVGIYVERHIDIRYRMFFAILFFTIIGSQFFESSVDYDNYAQYFELVRTLDFKEVLSNRIEPVFGVLTYLLVKAYSSNYSVYMNILVLSVALKAYILSLSKQIGSIFVLFVALYLCRYFFLYELTQLRASLAIGLILMAFQSHQSKYKFFFLILACLTHYSVVVLFPILLLEGYARNNNYAYSKNEKLIWITLLLLSTILGFLSYITLQYITPFFNVLQIYDIKGFGDVTVSRFSATIMLDIFWIILALVLQKYMTASTRFWIYVQLIGIIMFYALFDLPIMAFRIKELFSVFWLLYVREALEHDGLVRLHALLFIICNIITYIYIYFIGNSAIF